MTPDVSSLGRSNACSLPVASQHIVRGLKKLACLNLTHCRITSAGATQLVKLRELRSLTLYDCKARVPLTDWRMDARGGPRNSEGPTPEGAEHS